MRLFFALWPPHSVSERLFAWAATLRRRGDGRATARASIHLTLAFLGEQGADRAALAAAIARSVRGTAFELSVDRPGYFRHNRIVWGGPSVQPQALTALAHALAQALRDAQFDLDRRAFTPHVTLLRDACEPDHWPPLPAASWAVTEFLLIESVRDQRGATYVVRERFALEAPLNRSGPAA